MNQVKYQYLVKFECLAVIILRVRNAHSILTFTDTDIAEQVYFLFIVCHYCVDRSNYHKLKPN